MNREKSGKTSLIFLPVRSIMRSKYICTHGGMPEISDIRSSKGFVYDPGLAWFPNPRCNWFHNSEAGSSAGMKVHGDWKYLTSGLSVLLRCLSASGCQREKSAYYPGNQPLGLVNIRQNGIAAPNRCDSRSESFEMGIYLVPDSRIQMSLAKYNGFTWPQNIIFSLIYTLSDIRFQIFTVMDRNRLSEI